MSSGSNDSRLAWMKFFPSDFLAETRCLTTEQSGAYVALLCQYWMAGGRLPNDDGQLGRITGLTLSAWRKMRPTIETFFEPGWRHQRLDAEIKDARERYDKKAAAGRAGGNARARNSSETKSQKPAATADETPSKTTDAPEAPARQTQSAAEPATSTTRGTRVEDESSTRVAEERAPHSDFDQGMRSGRPDEPDPSRPDVDASQPTDEQDSSHVQVRLDFQRFWKTYPHKVGRAAAFTSFVAARRKTSLTTILEGVARYANDKPAGREWCNPKTWLEQERWSDEPAPVLKQTTSRRSIVDALTDRTAEAEASDRLD